MKWIKKLYNTSALNCELAQSCFATKHFEQRSTWTLPSSRNHHILFLLQGRAEVVCSDLSVKKQIKMDEMLFLHKNNTIIITALADTMFVLHSFQEVLPLSVDFFAEAMPATCQTINRKFYPLPTDALLQHFLKGILLYTSHQKIEFVADKKHQELFFLLEHQYTTQEKATFFAPLVGKQMDFKSLVRKQSAHSDSVQDLARRCNMTYATFLRRFKQNFSDSPKRWIDKQKVMRVCYLLEQTTTSFSFIMNELAFSSESRFTEFCKKHFRQTPTEIRNRAFARKP